MRNNPSLRGARHCFDGGRRGNLKMRLLRRFLKCCLAMTILFLCFVSASAFAAEVKAPQAVFQEAGAAYRAGEYAEAVTLYESLIEQNWLHGDVFYNLGNAYFKQKQLGRAILNYEKARKLDPRDRDLAANLIYARKLLEYRMQDKRNWYLKTSESLLKFFTPPEIGILSLGFGFLFWLTWGVALYFKPGLPWGPRRKTLLFLTATCLLLWTAKTVYSLTVEEAVTLKSKTVVRYGPSVKDQVAFRMGEGIKVRVTKKTEDWGQVLLPNGEAGWVSLEDIGVI